MWEIRRSMVHGRSAMPDATMRDAGFVTAACRKATSNAWPIVIGYGTVAAADQSI